MQNVCEAISTSKIPIYLSKEDERQLANSCWEKAITNNNKGESKRAIAKKMKDGLVKILKEFKLFRDHPRLLKNIAKVKTGCNDKTIKLFEMV